jgi:c-di-GMP-binding flagellar brake protein YcgR
MATQRGLTVRGFERQRLELFVEFVIAEEHRAQVRFSPNSAATDQFGVSGTTFDLSAGGLGFSAAQFLPRHCEGTIRVLAHSPIIGAGGQAKSAPTIDGAPSRLEHRAKVRRVWMNNREGTYAIGLAFINPTPALEAKVNEMLNEFETRIAGRVAPANGEHGASGDA